MLTYFETEVLLNCSELFIGPGIIQRIMDLMKLKQADTNTEKLNKCQGNKHNCTYSLYSSL